jgi:hypothetical protein
MATTIRAADGIDSRIRDAESNNTQPAKTPNELISYTEQQHNWRPRAF